MTNVKTQDDHRDLLAGFDFAFEDEQDRIAGLSSFERNRELGAPGWVGLDLSDVEPTAVEARAEVVEIEIDLSVLDAEEDWLDGEFFHV